jgi:hypothetical protein
MTREIVRNVQRRLTMKQNKCPTQEKRDKITDIQDLLIERYVEQKEAILEGDRCRAIELEFEIKELRREQDKLTHWSAV